MISPPGGIWQWLEILLVMKLWGVLLPSGGWRPGMLLNFLRRTGAPTTNHYLAPSVDSTRAGKFQSREFFVLFCFFLKQRQLRWSGKISKARCAKVWAEVFWEIPRPERHLLPDLVSPIGISTGRFPSAPQPRGRATANTAHLVPRTDLLRIPGQSSIRLQ